MRLLPLIPLTLWFAWTDLAHDGPPTSLIGPAGGPAGMLGVVLALPAMLSLGAWRVLRARTNDVLFRRARRFHRWASTGRLAIVGWFAACLFAGGYGEWVRDGVGSIGVGIDAYRLPGLLLAVAPVVVGWAGLWLAAYPVERQTREQSMLDWLDRDLPLHATPGPGRAVWTHLRTHVLFGVAPVLAALALRDAAALAYGLSTGRPLDGVAETLVFAASMAAVFVLAPEILVRVLGARPLGPADAELAAWLDRLGRDLGVRWRVRVWQTDFGVANAAVMGLFGRVRYLLLTDLLLESLPPRQLEAVFAHEAGHVRHRHLWWYVVLLGLFLLWLSGPGDAVLTGLRRLGVPGGWPLELGLFAASTIGFLLAFGWVARLFERQADAFAARAVGWADARRAGATTAASPLRVPVGPAGAEAFAEALWRVAELNRMEAILPPTGRSRIGRLSAWAWERLTNFVHPSLAERVAHVRALAADPADTRRFDRRVTSVLAGLLAAVGLLAAWVAVAWTAGG